MAYRLNPNTLDFPPVQYSDEDGLLAVGGDLSEERIKKAYNNGIFPWYSEYSPILWWSPNPRFVILPENFKFAKSLRPILRKREFRVTINTAFERVIQHCKMANRPNQHGTWITPEMQQAFINLHHEGFAHSVEVWKNEKLVGGLYGEIVGTCFFGESMFALEDNASKVGFIVLIKNLLHNGFEMIDCQVFTEHLSRFGADMIPRKEFIQRLEKGKEKPFDKESFESSFDDSVEFIFT
ncbi:leucyl/phenylalanyl-tRNA--protein transferase [Bernardetia sp. Wsw4-3y2]|uniref:leucyl/phenylalanyl-tRNA--protein transferase n=1 Tax=unclassified Bernardetia TaxID=2647129 RepID=UPI0030D2473A